METALTSSLSATSILAGYTSVYFYARLEEMHDTPVLLGFSILKQA